MQQKKCIERAELYQGNSLDSSLFNGEFIDLTVTSPPYNLNIDYNSNDDSLPYVKYLTFTREWLTNVYAWTKSTGRLCLNIPLDTNKGGKRPVGADITNIATSLGWKYHTTIVWNESNISRRTAWGSWLSASAPHIIAPVELILVLYKDEWKKKDRGQSDTERDEFIQWTNGLWTFNGESAKRVGHPAPFPEELPLRCIKLFSYVGDTIFDPFMGSGTTGVVAHKTERRFKGVELDDEYFSLSVNRIEQEVKSGWQTTLLHKQT